MIRQTSQRTREKKNNKTKQTGSSQLLPRPQFCEAYSYIVATSIVSTSHPFQCNIQKWNGKTTFVLSNFITEMKRLYNKTFFFKYLVCRTSTFKYLYSAFRLFQTSLRPSMTSKPLCFMVLKCSGVII